METQRAMVETLALGLANGVLLGIGLTAANRGYGLSLAFCIGTLLTLSYLLTSRWKRPN